MSLRRFDVEYVCLRDTHTHSHSHTHTKRDICRAGLNVESFVCFLCVYMYLCIHVPVYVMLYVALRIGVFFWCLMSFYFTVIFNF